MASGQDFLARHSGGSPGGSQLQKTVNRRVPLSLFVIASGDQVGDRLAVPRDSDGLAVLHVSQDLGEARLGLCGLNFPHEYDPSI